MSRLDELKKQRANNGTQKTSEKDYPEVLEAIMNRPGESKLKNTSKDIADIDVSLIDTDNINEQLFGYEDLNKIEQSFDTIGNNSIIYVYRRSNGRYLCFAGNQRLLATKNRGEKNITCMIAGDEPSETERIENYIFMNSQRTPRPYYIATQLVEYEKVLRKKGKSNISKLIEEKFGYKESMQRTYKQLLKLDESLWPLFKRDDIPFAFLLDKCKKIPSGKENEFAYVFTQKAENEEVTTDMINKVYSIVTQKDTEKENIPKYEKSSQVFKELSSLPYFKDDKIIIPREKKQIIKEQAEQYKLYLDKVLEACK